MTEQHTPGLLHIAGQDKVQIRSEKHQIAKAWSFAGKTGQENARRLVACWNACEDEDTEMLEAIVREGTTIRRRHDDALGWKEQYQGELCDVERQRDKLLAALRMVMACAGDIAAAPDGMLEMALDDGDEETRRQANAFLVARAAIAKVEGGAK